MAGLPPLRGSLRWLRIIGGIGIVFGYSPDKPTTGEQLKISLDRIGNLLVIDLATVHVDRKGLQIFFLLLRVLDRRLRPLVKRITFDAVLFCGGDIFREGVELTLSNSAMPG